MAVITISREYGSGGNQIASLLCDRLGYRYFDKAMMVQLGAPEQLKASLVAADAPTELPSERGTLWRFFHGLQASSPLGQSQGQDTNEVLPVDIIEGGIRRAYADGNVVIVGRGGQMVLRDQPGVLHVRVVAPLGTRAGNICRDDGLPSEAARERALTQERTASAYIRNTYHADLHDPALYDVIVNTGRLTPEACVDTILAALQHINRRPR